MGDAIFDDMGDDDEDDAIYHDEENGEEETPEHDPMIDAVISDKEEPSSSYHMQQRRDRLQEVRAQIQRLSHLVWLVRIWLKQVLLHSAHLILVFLGV